MIGMMKMHKNAGSMRWRWYSAFAAGYALAFLMHTGNAAAADTSSVEVLRATVFSALSTNGDNASTSATLPRDADVISNDVVVARVDGAPIYQSELNAGLPRDWFGASNDDLKASKLERLIFGTIISRFLDKNGIKVESSEIDADVEDMRQNPPLAGCMCCRYASLEQYMRANGYNMAELRRDLANDIGMNHYLAAEWDKSSPGVNKVSEQVEARVRKEYIKPSHIFFNTFQKFDFQKNPTAVRDLAMNNAKDALQRLSRGATFENLAAVMSEDAMSKTNGGLLGCIPRDVMGLKFAAAVDELKPGEYSKPVETPWGFHIIRRETMTDADILQIVRDEYIAGKMNVVRNDLFDAAKVERLWKPK